MTDTSSDFGSEPHARARTGRSLRRNRPLVVLGLVALVALAEPASAHEASEPVAPPASAALSLEALMAGFGAMSGLTAEFREERRLSLLREPLESRGAIYFLPPARFARVVRDPFPSRVVVDADQLRFAGDDGKGHIAIDSHPMIAVFVDSLRMILAGDLAGLRTLYEIDFASPDFASPDNGATPGSWSARFEPKGDVLGEWLARLTLRGQGLVVGEFVIVERNGDTTRMTFSEVDPRHTFSAGERALIFDLPDR